MRVPAYTFVGVRRPTSKQVKQDLQLLVLGEFFEDVTLSSFDARRGYLQAIADLRVLSAVSPRGVETYLHARNDYTCSLESSRSEYAWKQATRSFERKRVPERVQYEIVDVPEYGAASNASISF